MSGFRLPDTEETPETAVLLVLLPPLARDHAVAADLAVLQRQLGPGVQVLKVDQDANPAVVRSFAPLRLPACVLVHQGVELWRQEGLPIPEKILPLLLGQRAPTV